MAKKSTSNDNLDLLKNDIKNSEFKRIYVFIGEEQYLLETFLNKLREKLIPDGMEMFNHRRLNGKALGLNDLSDAIEAYPAFCEYTLTEVDDFDFGSLDDFGKKQILDILSDVPDYAVVVFRFDTVAMKLDGRLKIDFAIKKLMTIVEFKAQEGTTLIKWITAHVRANGHDISAHDAEFFAFYTGGLMANLNTEIDKVCASCAEKFVTRQDIERMVEPEINAAVFNMTDFLIRGEYGQALAVLRQLFEMQTEPRMIFAVTCTSIKQLYFTKIALSYGRNAEYISSVLGLRYSFQANKLIDGARRKSEKWCQAAVKLCVSTALALNTTSGTDDKDTVTDFIIKLAV